VCKKHGAKVNECELVMKQKSDDEKNPSEEDGVCKVWGKGSDGDVLRGVWMKGTGVTQERSNTSKGCVKQNSRQLYSMVEVKDDVI